MMNMGDKGMNAEREKFERWYFGEDAPTHATERSGETYKYMATQNAWKVWQARAALAQQDSADDQDRLFVLLCEIRAACGDNGQRMQPELVEYIRDIAEDAARYRWLRYGDNDELVIQHGPVAPDYHWLPRNERLDAMIDAHMQAQGAARQSDSKEA